MAKFDARFSTELALKLALKSLYGRLHGEGKESEKYQTRMHYMMLNGMRMRRQQMQQDEHKQQLIIVQLYRDSAHNCKQQCKMI